MPPTNPGLPAGKLPGELLGRLLSKIQRDDPRVVVGPGVGEDAAFLDFGDTLLVAKSDPVTFATDLAGWYTVQVNANDVACCGAIPKWFLGTALLPVGTTPDEVELIFDQIAEACDALGITMIGGHTEMTLDLPRPIISGTMLGEVEKGKEVMTAGARPGDRVILTKGIAIEGTSLLAREMRPQLKRAGVSASVLDRAADYLYEPGISVVPEARAAHAASGVTSMHDPTEGGLATALSEVSAASNTGMLINRDNVPILPEAAELCDALSVDPWGLIASGALLITAAPDSAAGVIDAVTGTGSPAVDIGEVRPAEDGLKLVSGGQELPFPIFERDEIARVLGA
ncbi:MAG: hydrogenase expression protein [Chloroflexi bacterium]|nr:hydrogenase expression protein [Chloroflexota bacterium]MBT4513549.1 hydrogenase expression protein [Chloroflexota bacterium]MBT5320501.1 hydrogenase expression protein [Chloroflexota bacterium]MBT6680772.1 hydrogenase expression protein [Chloroflexota bacterium]